MPTIGCGFTAIKAVVRIKSSALTGRRSILTKPNSGRRVSSYATVSVIVTSGVGLTAPDKRDVQLGIERRAVEVNRPNS
jgi:hypothetical protein